MECNRQQRNHHWCLHGCNTIEPCRCRVVLLLQAALKTLRGLGTGRKVRLPIPSISSAPKTEHQGGEREDVESPFSHHLSFQFQYGGRSPDPRRKTSPVSSCCSEVLFGFFSDFLGGLQPVCCVLRLCDLWRKVSSWCWEGLERLTEESEHTAWCPAYVCRRRRVLTPLSVSLFLFGVYLCIQIHIWVSRANSIQFQSSSSIFFLIEKKVKPCLVEGNSATKDRRTSMRQVLWLFFHFTMALLIS